MKVLSRADVRRWILALAVGLSCLLSVTGALAQSSPEKPGGDEPGKLTSSDLWNFAGNSVYGFQALAALWGTYCAVFAWSRITKKRFRSEEAQIEFLQTLEEPLTRGDFEGAKLVCEGDPRVLCQLAHLAITSRNIGYKKARQLVVDRFQRDLMADLQRRLDWTNTMIKFAPMLGLLGTVLGMMGAFGQLATADTVKPSELAGNISVALITTAVGLIIAIPLGLWSAKIYLGMRRMEDLVGAGLERFFEGYRTGLARRPGA